MYNTMFTNLFLWSVKELQKNWKSLRDRYVRHIRTIKLPSGSDGVKPKPYTYANQLSFLSDTVEERP